MNELELLARYAKDHGMTYGQLQSMLSLGKISRAEITDYGGRRENKVPEDFFNLRMIVKSRKEHVCDFCGCKIPQKTKYIRYSGKAEGRMFDIKYCPVCAQSIDHTKDGSEIEPMDFADVVDYERDTTCRKLCGDYADTCTKINLCECEKFRRYWMEAAEHE